MNTDLLKGNIRKSILVFAFPLFISLLFQTLYNTADTVIIGYFLGDQSLAAVGAVAAIFELLVGFCSGFGQGLGIIAGQAYGAKEHRKLRHICGLSILLCLAVALPLTAVSIWGLPGFLQILATPLDIYAQSLAYISIIAFGLVITIFFNLCAAMLRAIGDSITPLIILLISSAINIVLDYGFIVWFRMGVEGTAWATLIAQGISLLICLGWIARKTRVLVPKREDFKWNRSLATSLCEMGFSMALMSSIVSIGTIVLQRAINDLGTVIISGHTATRKLIAIANLPVAALMNALSSFVAQNTGARQYERVCTGIAFANRFGLYYSIACTLFTFVFSQWMIQTISGSQNPQVIAIGSLYLKTNIPFFFVLALVLNVRSSLQAMSLKIVPVLSSVVELVGKIVFSILVVPFAGYLGVCFTEPFVWSAMAIFLCVYYVRNPLFKEKGIRAGIWRVAPIRHQ